MLCGVEACSAYHRFVSLVCCCPAYVPNLHLCDSALQSLNTLHGVNEECHLAVTPETIHLDIMPIKPWDRATLREFGFKVAFDSGGTATKMCDPCLIKFFLPGRAIMKT